MRIELWEYLICNCKSVCIDSMQFVKTAILGAEKEKKKTVGLEQCDQIE